MIPKHKTLLRPSRDASSYHPRSRSPHTTPAAQNPTWREFDVSQMKDTLDLGSSSVLAYPHARTILIVSHSSEDFTRLFLVHHRWRKRRDCLSCVHHFDCLDTHVKRLTLLPTVATCQHRAEFVVRLWGAYFDIDTTVAKHSAPKAEFALLVQWDLDLYGLDFFRAKV